MTTEKNQRRRQRKRHEAAFLDVMATQGRAANKAPQNRRRDNLAESKRRHVAILKRQIGRLAQTIWGKYWVAKLRELLPSGISTLELEATRDKLAGMIEKQNG